MLLRKINLHHFRNFEKKEFEFSPFLTIIAGENARGKTNLLESIYFVINGTGFRETREEELIHFDKKETRVEAVFDIDDQSFEYKITLSKEDELVEKSFFINKTKKKHFQYISSQTKAVLFSPEQIEIMIGAPDRRRDYFNKLISFYDYEYKKKLGNYDNALRRRNKILETVHDEEKLKEELSFWDEYLEEQATYITRKRQEYTDFLNEHNKVNSQEFSIEYLKSELTKEKLKETQAMERRYRRTLIGPQKDDFQISEKDKKKIKNLHRFGSRGEQRMAIFWLKLNEINYYEKVVNKKPIILLDDVFSEFDIKNKKLILNLVKDYQTVVTTTEEKLVGLTNISKKVISL
jgi:DNA replication and repair protein RecF